MSFVAVTSNRYSSSASMLAKAIHCRYYHTKRPLEEEFAPTLVNVINYGGGTKVLDFIPELYADVTYINHPNLVNVAKNKLKTLRCLKENGVAVPDFSTNYAELRGRWSKAIIVQRTKLEASCGQGIVIIRPEDTRSFGDGLFVKYIRKDREYRVHVVDGKAIHVQQKRKRLNAPADVGDEALIRNVGNTWVFDSSKIDAVGGKMDELTSTAIDAVKAIGLDFGAVDIVESKDGKFYVLEVNTAPGIGSMELLNEYAFSLIGLLGKLHREHNTTA